MEDSAVGLVQRYEARRDEVYHESRGEDDQLVREVVGAQEFGGCEVGDRVEAHGQVGEACDARDGVGDRGFEHEGEEPARMPADRKDRRGERLPHAEPERGQCREHHRKRDGRDGIEAEHAECDAHDGGVRYGVEYFRDEQLFPEVPADEVPVEERVLEQ